MKKCVMDNFRVLRGLEELAEKAISVLNGTRNARSHSCAIAFNAVMSC